jgi:hypothetical protein
MEHDDIAGDLARAPLVLALTVFTACSACGAEVTDHFESSAKQKLRKIASLSVAGDRLRPGTQIALRAPDHCRPNLFRDTRLHFGPRHRSLTSSKEKKIGDRLTAKPAGFSHLDSTKSCDAFGPERSATDVRPPSTADAPRGRESCVDFT